MALTSIERPQCVRASCSDGIPAYAGSGAKIFRWLAYELCSVFPGAVPGEMRLIVTRSTRARTPQPNAVDRRVGIAADTIAADSVDVRIPRNVRVTVRVPPTRLVRSENVGIG
jgi:hypothetical protein